MLNHYIATVLKIWSSNVLYSEDYTTLLSTVMDKGYTVEQVVTAMNCCGDLDHKLCVPDCFKKIVSHQDKDAVKSVLSQQMSLFIASAVINGDFTVYV